MKISAQEQRLLMDLWGRNERVLRMLFDKALEDCEDKLVRPDSEWDAVRMSIEYAAKKQVILDLKNALSKSYAATTFGK